MTDTRMHAVSCLIGILKHGDRPKNSIDQFSDRMDRRDRAFVMEIVYGVLRNLYSLDHVSGAYIKNTKTLSATTINNMRIALYQILFMRVPGYAVVNEAVEMEKKDGKPSLVNAVLRNILRNRDAVSMSVTCADPAKEISINTSHQEWMIRNWIKRFGKDQARQLAEANNCIPPLVLRANTLRISREELLTKLEENSISAKASHYAPDGIIINSASSYSDLACVEGLFAVQDEASQLISCLLSPAKGERILDACAAPGGKTTHIAQLMEDSGEIIAVDKDPKRLTRLRDNIRVLGVQSAKVTQADIANPGDIGFFDRILLDAPCSSTGVIRRNPDVKFRYTSKNITEFGKRQSELLQAAARLTKRGGRLVYSVCSMEPQEGEQVITDFLKTTDDFRIIDADQEYMKPFVKNGFFRTFPHIHNMDGFFCVILCRKA